MLSTVPRAFIPTPDLGSFTVHGVGVRMRVCTPAQGCGGSGAGAGDDPPPLIQGPTLSKIPLFSNSEQSWGPGGERGSLSSPLQHMERAEPHSKG